jgi:hypothetical protein
MEIGKDQKKLTAEQLAASIEAAKEMKKNLIIGFEKFISQFEEEAIVEASWHQYKAFNKSEEYENGLEEADFFFTLIEENLWLEATEGDAGTYVDHVSSKNY